MFSKFCEKFYRFFPLSPVVVLVLCAGNIYAQVEPCPESGPQTTGTHKFRRANDIFDVPILLPDCQPVALDLRWSNGANKGSNFIVTFLDDNSQPIYSKQIWGFMTGNQQFSFSTLDWLGSASMMSVPAAVTIQAVEPFAFPSSISYRVTRVARHPKRKLEAIDTNLETSLRIAPGTLVAQGQVSRFVTYKLEEVGFDEPREIERYGTKDTIDKAFRLTLKGNELANAGLIWLDDVAVSAFWDNGRQSSIALIYDATILRDGAEISVSNVDSTRLRVLSERLRLPATFRPPAPLTEEGNSIVKIKGAVRSIGGTRQPLIQVELKTNRPFPARDSALQLQVGKRFFVHELSGDYTGRTLTLTLTPEMFAELKDGAEIVAFFDRPDRSGALGQDIWCFGRLNKATLDRATLDR